MGRKEKIERGRGGKDRRAVTLHFAILLAGWALVGGMLPAQGPPRQLPLEPLHDSGQSVTPAFEGWFRNPDGSFSILWGYFNRNLKEALDIPIGPNNRMEPGGPDRGQPTHIPSSPAMGRLHRDGAKGFREQ